MQCGQRMAQICQRLHDQELSWQLLCEHVLARVEECHRQIRQRIKNTKSVLSIAVRIQIHHKYTALDLDT